MSIVSSIALTFSSSSAEAKNGTKASSTVNGLVRNDLLPTSGEETAHIPLVSVTAQSTTQNSSQSLPTLISNETNSESSSTTSSAISPAPTPSNSNSNIYVVSPRAVDANATLINNMGTTMPISPSAQLINDLLESDDVVLGDEESVDDEDEDVEVEDEEEDDSQLEFEDTYPRSNSTLNSLYAPNNLNNNNKLNNDIDGRSNDAYLARPRCPAITVGHAKTGDKTISWTATSSDGKTIQRATKITYYTREKALNNATDLFSRWGLTQARGERLPTAVNNTFQPYVNSRTMMGRFSMPSVFTMFSALDVEENHDDGSDLVSYDN